MKDVSKVVVVQFMKDSKNEAWCEIEPIHQTVHEMDRLRIFDVPIVHLEANIDEESVDGVASVDVHCCPTAVESEEDIGSIQTGVRGS